MAAVLKKKLTIPNPCSENWDTMTPAEKGRFCKSCSTIVTDFSTYTDSELLEYFSKAKGETCGRFNVAQLNHILVANDPSQTPVFRKLLFGTALAAGCVGIAHGQNNTHSIPAGTIDSSGKINTFSISKKNKVVAKDSIQITGKILDNKTKNPIPHATISFVLEGNTEILAQADESGKYAVSLPANYLNKKISATASSSYYDSKTEDFIIKTSSDTINIRIKKSKKSTHYLAGNVRYL